MIGRLGTSCPVVSENHPLTHTGQATASGAGLRKVIPFRRAFSSGVEGQRLSQKLERPPKADKIPLGRDLF